VLPDLRDVCIGFVAERSTRFRCWREQDELRTAEHARIVNGLLGGAIAAIESFVQFRHFDKNWHRWAAAESLKRERYLFLQSAGPYADATTPKSNATLLAERVEGIIGAEQDAWLALATKVEAESRARTTSA
jgi:hypothetical protein